MEFVGILLRLVARWFSWFVIAYFIIINVVYLLMLVSSFLAILRYKRRNRFFDSEIIIQSEFSTPISVLAPAFNEEATIVENVNSLRKLNYSTMEVIIINDGSTDGTMATLIREFGLKKSHQVYVRKIPTKPVRGIYLSDRPDLKNLVVVDKENGGKADALNVGINVSRYPLFCAIDADSILEDDALRMVARPFLEDDTVIAVGGIVRIANGCEIDHGRVRKVGLSKKHLPTFQVVEYLRAFLSGRMGWSAMNGLLIISGAFGLFRKNIVLDCGGYRHDTVGEDMELVARMHRHMYENDLPYRVVFVPDPVCWTEAPETIKILSRQRNRWHRGLLDTLYIHKKMIFNPRFGVIGLFSIPYYLMFELLGPVIETLGYVTIVFSYFYGAVNLKLLGAFFLVAIIYGMLFSVGAVLLEEISFHKYRRGRDLLKLVAYAVIENFGYRQMTVVWRIKGIWDYVLGERTSWGQMQRTGFTAGPKKESPVPAGE
ncbi:MAG TPA: glycosyltransferase [Bacteroidota bacterium]|nr:glycosyltransferase [Bacteroidota bacterium]